VIRLLKIFGKSKKNSRKRVKRKVRKPKKVRKKMKNIRRVKPKVKIRKSVEKVRKLKPKKVKVVKPLFNKMPDEKAFDILKRYRITVPTYAFCKNEKELYLALKRVGFPCVMKVSGNILHRTDVKGVKTDIENEEEAMKNFKEVIKIKGCDKVLVQKMIKEGYEIIVGGKKDPQFNRVVALGAGGIFTEFLKDVSFRIAPLSRRDAEEMLKEVRFSDLILKGFRGQKPANPDSIIDTILSVSRIMEKYPQIKELDINPLFATSTKAIAADVRIILE
jgi:acyl-CoA synthetase (NDP forming)